MSPTSEADDTGVAVDVPAAVRRVVSLVPSLTEAVAVSAPGLLVGATDWCTHPGGLDVARIGGTKNPRVDDVLALRPDVVLANTEENRDVEIDALRAAGVAVWVTFPRTVAESLVSLRRMLTLGCRLEEPSWLGEAEQAWADVVPLQPRRRAVVPVWRRPWMAVGSGTFTGDVLSRLGVDNVLGGDPERYPKVVLADLPAHDLVVLPDEPYLFTAADGPEAFAGVAAALVSGRFLTWYGPSLVRAPRELAAQLAAALPAQR